MSSTTTKTQTLRDVLNQATPGQVPDALRKLSVGEALALLLSAASPTESGATVTNDAGTLADPAKALFRVKGIKSGPVTAELEIVSADVVPSAGQVAWDGSDGLTFAAADAWTTFDALYTTGDDEEVSALDKSFPITGP